MFKNKYIIKKYNYKILKKIKKESIKFDFLGDYVLQGVCQVNDYIFLTSYDGSKEKRSNSRITVLDKNYKLLKHVILDTNSHVGGICFDDKHKNIWVTEKDGSINGYALYDILYCKDKVESKFKKVKLGNDFINNSNINSVAYITYYKDKIYAGCYNNYKKSILKSFSINQDGSINLNNNKIMNFTEYVQGISFYDFNNKDYLIVSSYHGILGNSYIKVFEYNEKINNYNEEKYILYKLPPMIEQINANRNNELLVIFESNAKKYKSIFMRNDDLLIFNIKDIIDHYLYKI